ncbi:MAG: ribosomal protein [Actinobacteria bacterium]|jgi:large subunit ribosomal protein L10|nr:ribosomal protein [Actinomycetota bacterium]MEA2504503.1 large subunit ribosomal protein [Actinomycetota bacterium]
MPKAQKIEAVERLKGEFRESQAALLTSFRGLKVAEMTELRRSLAASQTDFKVVKNTLAKIAAKDIGLEDLLPLLEGSTAIAFVKGDPVTAAKGLDEISRKYPALVLKGGLLTGRVLSAERAAALAHVAPREVLLAQIAGAFQAPLSKLAALLQAPVRSLGYALGAYREKVTAGAPAPEAAADEAAPAEPAPEPTAPAPAPEADTEAQATP